MGRCIQYRPGETANPFLKTLKTSGRGPSGREWGTNELQWLQIDFHEDCALFADQVGSNESNNVPSSSPRQEEASTVEDMDRESQVESSAIQTSPFPKPATHPHVREQKQALRSSPPVTPPMEDRGLGLTFPVGDLPTWNVLDQINSKTTEEPAEDDNSSANCWLDDIADTSESSNEKRTEELELPATGFALPNGSSVDTETANGPGEKHKRAISILSSSSEQSVLQAKRSKTTQDKSEEEVTWSARNLLSEFGNIFTDNTEPWHVRVFNRSPGEKTVSPYGRSCVTKPDLKWGLTITSTTGKEAQTFIYFEIKRLTHQMQPENILGQEVASLLAAANKRHLPIDNGGGGDQRSKRKPWQKDDDVLTSFLVSWHHLQVYISRLTVRREFLEGIQSSSAGNIQPGSIKISRSKHYDLTDADQRIAFLGALVSVCLMDLSRHKSCEELVRHIKTALR
ncbi:MAG: hypothetical protein Q9159_005392 [Coniocarpon cinnabarinum]